MLSPLSLSLSSPCGDPTHTAATAPVPASCVRRQGRIGRPAGPPARRHAELPEALRLHRGLRRPGDTSAAGSTADLPTPPHHRTASSAADLPDPPRHGTAGSAADIPAPPRHGTAGSAADIPAPPLHRTAGSAADLLAPPRNRARPLQRRSSCSGPWRSSPPTLPRGQAPKLQRRRRGRPRRGRRHRRPEGHSRLIEKLEPSCRVTDDATSSTSPAPPQSPPCRRLVFSSLPTAVTVDSSSPLLGAVAAACTWQRWRQRVAVGCSFGARWRGIWREEGGMDRGCRGSGVFPSGGARHISRATGEG
jgi:hypothetical protein